MGVYIFTMRSRAVSLLLASGEKVSANLYSYAYRMTSYWPGDRGYRSYKFMEENAARNARNAFAKPRSGYVIVGDFGGGRDKKPSYLNLEGDAVYTDVTEPVWYDTDKFPGKFVGWVGVQGSKLVLSDRTGWTDCKESRPEGWVPVRYRSLLVDGKIQREAYDLGPPEQSSSVRNF